MPELHRRAANLAKNLLTAVDCQLGELIVLTNTVQLDDRAVNAKLYSIILLLEIIRQHIERYHYHLDRVESAASYRQYRASWLEHLAQIPDRWTETARELEAALRTELHITEDRQQDLAV